MKSKAKSNFWNVILAVAGIMLGSDGLMARSVSYEEFGAKGDGASDDLEAIVKAHEQANRVGSSVRAKDGAIYYIGGKNLTATIQTNTDFGSATFILDDRTLENHQAPFFRVSTELQPFPLKDVKNLKKGQTKIAGDFDRPCMVEVYNHKVKLFKRLGKNHNSGSDQRDFFLVDGEGHIDPMTPIIWDFEEITKIEARYLDKEQLVISGGNFITYPPDKVATSYHSRGIEVQRSNVLVEKLRHDVQKEGKDGPPYRGIIVVSKAANVTLRDVIFTGRRVYFKKAKVEGYVRMGTYDLTLDSSLNVKLINCSQTNDIQNPKYWGIMGTNFCKNLVLENCTLSRFDAHQGVANATIKNSTIGYMGIKAIGHGLFTIEDTTVRGNCFVDFRGDYGSTWDGDFVIKNSRLISGSEDSVSIFRGDNAESHDFGYVCHLPQKVVVNNFLIEDGERKEKFSPVYIFNDINPDHKNADYRPKFPVVPPKEVVIKNVKADSGSKVELSSNPYFFRNVRFQYEGKP